MASPDNERDSKLQDVPIEGNPTAESPEPKSRAAFSPTPSGSSDDEGRRRFRVDVDREGSRRDDGDEDDDVGSMSPATRIVASSKPPRATPDTRRHMRSPHPSPRSPRMPPVRLPRTYVPMGTHAEEEEGGQDDERSGKARRKLSDKSDKDDGFKRPRDVAVSKKGTNIDKEEKGGGSGGREAKSADGEAGAGAAAASGAGRTGGVYVPPFKLARMLQQVTDRSSAEFQRLTWDALRKSINGLVNKVNASNLKNIIPELFAENLIRGRGLFVRAAIKSQMASPTFTHVLAALVAVVNTKMPEIGDLLLRRIILQFRRGFRRNDKVGRGLGGGGGGGGKGWPGLAQLLERSPS